MTVETRTAARLLVWRKGDGETSDGGDGGWAQRRRREKLRPGKDVWVWWCVGSMERAGAWVRGCVGGTALSSQVAGLLPPPTLLAWPGWRAGGFSCLLIFDWEGATTLRGKVGTCLHHSNFPSCSPFTAVEPLPSAEI